MIDTHKEIYLFLQGKSEKGLEIITNIFFKQLYSPSYQHLTNIEEPEDLFMEFITKILEKREFLINLFEKQENGLPSYIRQMAKNFLKDKYRQMSGTVLESVSDYEWSLSDESKSPKSEIIKIDALSLKNFLDKNLKEEEFLLLCYIVSENKREFEEKHFKGIKKDALYKRVQRIKEKLRKLLSEYSEDTVGYYLEFILPSICKRGNENG